MKIICKFLLLTILLTITLSLCSCSGKNIEINEGEYFKTTYQVGEEIDLSGMQLNVKDGNETVEVVNVTNEMIEDFSTTEAKSNQTATIKYQGMKTKFKYCVQNQNDIKIDTWKFETKIEYIANQELPFYALDYCYDYNFDEFLQVGAKSTAELRAFFDTINLGAEITSIHSGCSTIIAETKSTNYMVRNYDYNTTIPLILRTTPTNGYASISIADMAHFGFIYQNLPHAQQTGMMLATPYVAMDGINEMGVSICVNMLPEAPIQATPSSKIDITTSTAIRLVLDKASSVKEAIKLLSNYDMYTDESAFHFVIADNAGYSAIVEYETNGTMHCTYKESGKNYQVCTNHTISEDIESVSLVESVGRLERIENGLKQSTDKRTKEHLLSAIKTAIFPFTQGQPLGSHSTKWTVVYDLSTIVADVYILGNLDEAPYEFSF